MNRRRSRAAVNLAVEMVDARSEKLAAAEDRADRLAAMVAWLLS